MRFNKFWISGSIALTMTTVSSATNLTGMMTVDNVFNAFISTSDNVQGTLVGSGNSWPAAQPVGAVLLAGQDYYLHIVATDQGAPAMFIGSFSLSGSDHTFVNNTQSQLTNTADWLVSSTGFGSGYVAPQDLGPQGTSPWGTFASIDPAARFIWAPNTNTGTQFFSTKISAVPEPATMVIAATALVAMARRRRNN